VLPCNLPSRLCLAALAGWKAETGFQRTFYKFVIIVAGSPFSLKNVKFFYAFLKAHIVPIVGFCVSENEHLSLPS
jgi:hypothetical protein